MQKKERSISPPKKVGKWIAGSHCSGFETFLDPIPFPKPEREKFYQFLFSHLRHGRMVVFPFFCSFVVAAVCFAAKIVIPFWFAQRAFAAMYFPIRIPGGVFLAYALLFFTFNHFVFFLLFLFLNSIWGKKRCLFLSLCIDFSGFHRWWDENYFWTVNF